MSPPQQGADGPRRPSSWPGDLSTRLLDDVWANALDPAYAAADKRRERSANAGPVTTERQWSRSIRLAIVLGLVGLVAAVAAGQVRRTLSGASGTKIALLSQVRAAERNADAMVATAEQLRRQVAGQRSRLLATSAAGTALAAELGLLEAATAQVPVTGPGLVVRLADVAVPASEVPGYTHRVTDRDLQDLVNALWAAGAEAVSINGERLGPESAIRTAGEAILVNFRPVSSPYQVQAIGNRDSMQTSLANSATGQQLQTLHSVYGIGFTVHTSARLALSAETLPNPPLAVAGAGSSP